MQEEFATVQLHGVAPPKGTGSLSSTMQAVDPHNQGQIEADLTALRR
jgi:hypothetical protein